MEALEAFEGLSWGSLGALWEVSWDPFWGLGVLLRAILEAGSPVTRAGYRSAGGSCKRESMRRKEGSGKRGSRRKQELWRPWRPSRGSLGALLGLPWGSLWGLGVLSGAILEAGTLVPRAGHRCAGGSSMRDSIANKIYF